MTSRSPIYSPPRWGPYNPNWLWPNVRLQQGPHIIPPGRQVGWQVFEELKQSYNPSWWQPNLTLVQGLQTIPPGKFVFASRSLTAYDPFWQPQNLATLHFSVPMPHNKTDWPETTQPIILTPWLRPLNLTPLYGAQKIPPGGRIFADYKQSYNPTWLQTKNVTITLPQPFPIAIGKNDDIIYPIVYPIRPVADWQPPNLALLNPPPVIQPVQLPPPVIRDHWDRDERGNFLPGRGYHRL